ncbi:MAG: SDR family oxidoreductase [Balneolaceae bacterium]
MIITGGNRGIGRQVALEFARATDHPLFLIARDREALTAVKNECREAGSAAVETAVCDLADADSIRSLDLPDSLPKPGVLVNNAGSFLLKKLEQTELGEFELQLAVDVLGPFQLIKKFLPRLKQQERGLIVQISSVGALTGQPRSGAYSSAKHAALGLSRSLRLELKDTKIAVTAINLGQTMSTSWEGIDVDPDELIDPADIGKLIVLLTRLSPRTVAEEITVRPQRGDRSPD